MVQNVANPGSAFFANPGPAFFAALGPREVGTVGGSNGLPGQEGVGVLFVAPRYCLLS